jgi:hemolysin activation/secretion protein
LLAAALPGPGVLAQTPPDAGALRQQIEQGREPAPPTQLAPPTPAEPAALSGRDGLLVTVSSFRLAGNTLLTAEQLQPALRSFLNRPLDYNQLQAAAAAVAEIYRQAGWVVRAYLPEQDIVDGVLTIQIVEAVFGGVQLEGPPATRVNLARIERMVEAQQKTGSVLNADALDRALLLADDLPGVAVSGSLREGSQSGQTELVLRMSDKPLLSGNVQLDNSGNRSTGAARLSADLNLNSAMRWGDLLSSSAIHTEGSDYLRLGFTAPVGPRGWRLGANASTLSYKLVLPEFAALHASGTSNSVGLEASYPLLRTRLHSLYFNANLDRKDYDNQANGTTSSHYASDTVSLGLWGNLFDNLGGGGANNFSLTLGTGQLDLAGSPSQANDAASTRTEGGFHKLRYSISRQQVLNANLALYLATSGQLADTNLDSSEKFYLGGSSGVRAYPSSEAGGATGQMLTLELRWRLPQGLNLSAFYDSGQVSANRNNQFARAPAVNDTALSGYGLALAWQSSAGLNLKASWSQRAGSNPNPTAAGNDQDGSLLMDRWWFNASLPF